MIDRARQTVRFGRPIAVLYAVLAAALALFSFALGRERQRREVAQQADHATNEDGNPAVVPSALVGARVVAAVAVAAAVWWVVREQLHYDWLLIAVIATLLAIAVDTVRTRVQWRLAGSIAAAFGVAYVVADIVEDHTLQTLLGDPTPEAAALSRLSIAAAIKIGSLLAASPVVLASLSMSFLDSFRPAREIALRHRQSRAERARLFIARTVQRRTGHEASVVADPTFVASTDAGAGLCASGGGIRSAAFNLGILQSMSVAPEPAADAEISRLRWITAVSGGSYMAAAWVVARQQRGPDSWLRLSPEESHLRRNASYLAPGIGGKLWAVTRYLFGLGINLGVVVLFLGAVAMPFGWLVDRGQQADPVSADGVVELAAGGCVVRPGGTFVLVDAGAELPVLSGTDVKLEEGKRDIAPARKSKPRNVSPPTTHTPTATETMSALEQCEQTMSDLAAAEGRSTSTSALLPVPTAAAPPAATTAGSPTTTTTLRPQALPDRKLVKGTKVALDLDKHAVMLDAHSVNGCEVVKQECEASLVEIPARSRVVTAPEARLVVASDVIVSRNALTRDCGLTACLEWAGWGWLRAVVWIAVALAVLGGIGVALTRLDPAQARLSQQWTRRLVVTALVAVFWLEFLPRLVTWAENEVRTFEEGLPTTVGVGSGVIVLALASQLLNISNGSKGSGPTAWVAKQAKSAWKRFQPLLVRAVAYVAGPLFVLALFLVFATGSARNGLLPDQWAMWMLIVGYLAAILAVGDLNEWSLHPFYREQLKTAFAADPQDPNAACGPAPLHELPEAPELIVCAAANVADKRFTPPGRPVMSWTFSRAGMGSRELGMMAVDPQAGTAKKLPKSMEHLNSTWTSVAVSGAAFSPAMGKMTRAERMLLALGNLRLGQWYPNPLFAGSIDLERGHRDWIAWYESHYPRPWYLAKEALGLHSGRDAWIYVTDGGHFENLGLVELLRRRCLEIYCFDAAGDSTDTFGTLADAMRIARADLGVEIEIDIDRIKADDDGLSKYGVTAGSVRYPGSQDGQHSETTGWIILAKLVVPEHGPFDIRDLARTLPSFPNHPTADQLYTDQKFEAYRALGETLGRDAVSLATKIRANLNGQPSTTPPDSRVILAVEQALAGD